MASNCSGEVPQQSVDEKRIKLQWWIRYNLAATRIQKNVRMWMCRKNFIHQFPSRRLRQYYDSPRIAREMCPSLKDSFSDVIHGNATFAQMMSFWRAVIELRKAHSSYSTDLLIKALINAEGDLARAIILLGSREFVVKNNGHNLPKRLRDVFLPQLMFYTRSVANPLYADTVLSDHTIDMKTNDNRLYQSHDSHFLRKTTGLHGVRKLRMQHAQTDRIQKKSELFSALNEVMAESFFSQNLVTSVGSHSAGVPYKSGEGAGGKGNAESHIAAKKKKMQMTARKGENEMSMRVLQKNFEAHNSMNYLCKRYSS